MRHVVVLLWSLISGEIRLGGQEHFYMETQSMVVVPSGEERELKVYLSCQHPTYNQVRSTLFPQSPSLRIRKYQIVTVEV